MTFTVEQWKEAARAKYAELAAWWKRQGRPAGVFAYGSLTALTLWPLVEAVAYAAQAGQPLPLSAILALGSVAGGVGGDLLASQIQTWYEASRGGKRPTEEDVLDWLAENALQKEDVQPALDQILQELGAISAASSAMPAADWQPFFAQLLSAMAEIGNFPRYEAQLLGDGLIVQGEGNRLYMATTNQQGQVVRGHQINIGHMSPGAAVNIHHHEAPVDPARLDARALHDAYLSRLLVEHNRLLLGGIDPKAVTAEQERLRLSAVYTALLTESRVGEHLPGAPSPREVPRPEARRLSAVEQLNREPRLVILGDPGSGKSTFVNFAALCLAGHALGHEELNIGLLTTPLPADDESQKEDQTPQPWDHPALLPVCITLREFAARGLPPAGEKGTAAHLWRFLHKELRAAGLEAFLPLLKKEMLEQGGVFMFDGLDEVPAADQHRLQIKQVVEDVAATYGKSHVLVTSRTYAYQKQDWRLPGFAETVLAPFSKGQIAHFVDRWYAQLATTSRYSAEDARGKAALLKDAIFGSRRLYDLAERPLLLTLMASLHAWRGGSLPEKRELLYADAVDLLLDVWEQQRVVRAADGRLQVVQPSLEQWLAVDRDKVRGLLNRLAYEGHKSQREEDVGTADIPEAELVMGLLDLSEDKSLPPRQLVEYLSNRAGLLLPRGQGIFTFPHRTFQEYLAACHLTASGYPARVAQLARRAPNRWREVALLAGAKAARGSDYALWGLIEELCHETPGAGGEEAFWGAHLAGQLLAETAVLEGLTAAQTRRLDHVRDWLVQVLREPLLPAAERALAGRHLALLGDPRPEVLDVDAMQFCLVPAGDFWLGEEDLELVSFIDYDFWLARYPVTVAHYRTFVEDGGYANEAWWVEAIAAERWKNGTFAGRTAPYDWGPAFAVANQPVVGVSWYEALAFTRWLAARWRDMGLLPAGWRAVLPSEAEWEKGARGGLAVPSQAWPRALSPQLFAGPDWPLEQRENPHPRRPYSWQGEEITTELANYAASEINRPTAAGCFPLARSACGCEELLGNVFEWTRSLYKDYPYDPRDGRETLRRGPTDWTVLRGGSWALSEKYVRCGARYRHNPDNVNYPYGLRVALSPTDSGR